MNILIVRLSSIGDVVHALSAVEPLRRHFPDCTIAWVVEEKAADLIKGYPGIDRVIVSRRKQWLEDLHRLTCFRVAGGVREFLKELRRDPYEIIIDFQGLFKSGIIVFFARGKRKVGYMNAREASTLFYSEKAPPSDFNDHAIKRHAALVHYLGVKESPDSFSLPLHREDENNIEGLFDSENIDRNRPVVCFHPTSEWATKRWDHGKAAGLCDILKKEFSCQILLVGGAEENKFLDSICSLLNGQAKNLAGKTSLRELACLVSKSDLMVSMDSGPMHISCAVGTPVVALFGPTAPWRTGPFGDSYSVVRKELPCSPCFKKRKCPEGHHRCMQDITVEDVFKVCCNYLGR